MTKLLPRAFYAKKVVKDLLGKMLVRKSTQGTIKGKIVETETYCAEKDPASHAFRDRTERAKIMWEMPEQPIFILSTACVAYLTY